MESFFEILNDEFKELSGLGLKIEQNIFENPALSIMNSRLFAEKILEEVSKKEGLEYIISLSQFERIRMLNKDGILDDNIVRDFDDVRITGNRAVHEGKNNDIEYSVRLHKKLYNIVKWFFEAYSSDYNVSVPIYSLPDINKAKKEINTLDIDTIVKQKVTEFLEQTQKKVLAEEKGIERDANKSEEELKEEALIMDIFGYKYKDEILKEDIDEVNEVISIEPGEESEKQIQYTYKKLKGSYLLNELSKLSTSSKEAVESCESLDSFKEYLHVERSVQGELLSLLEEAQERDESQLILLCGSVGDGKSHLIAYFNEHYPELMKDFNIHNDATESFDPNLTEIETLAEVLKGFSDENIETSREKLILAINLGVLNNFLEEDFAKENYKKLIKFIEESKVFNQETISDGYKDNNFKLVSFGNYNLYELTNDGAKSDYIEKILNKIILKDKNNVFYNAYLKDIDEGLNSPTILNYKMLTIPGVTERVSELIIMTMVKYKKLLGTREILNFIYEILVPANIEEFDMGSSVIDYLCSLLPNLLFNSLDRGLLLNIMNKEDVLKIRDEKIDELLIRLNISSDLIAVLGEYIDSDRLEVVQLILGDIINLNLLSETIKQDVVDTIIRMLRLIGNETMLEVFKDRAFEKYMIYLYNFNIGKLKDYKELFEEVREAVFNWNGYPKDKYIYLNEKLQNFKVAENLNLAFSKKGTCPTKNDLVIERFKTNINVAFEVKDKSQSELLELDYQLYKKIVDVNSGYHASKNDREEAVIFVEFIDKLLALGNMENELLIEDKRDKKVFKLIYENDFDEEFKFERVD